MKRYKGIKLQKVLFQYSVSIFSVKFTFLVSNLFPGRSNVSSLFPECHWSKAISGGWKPGGSEVRHHAHHVHVPCSFCHRWIRLCGEPIIRRYNGTRLHARREGRTREICTGGEDINTQKQTFTILICMILSVPHLFLNYSIFLNTSFMFCYIFFNVFLSLLQVATKTLPFYKDYFSVPYPLPKIDLIAIADFAAGE